MLTNDERLTLDSLVRIHPTTRKVTPLQMAREVYLREHAGERVQLEIYGYVLPGGKRDKQTDLR